jgi:TM2 domain-containing membrane protein YozV
MSDPNFKDRRNYWVLLFFAVFLGWAGMDRFYMGKAWTGFFKLFTFGGLGVLWFYDLIAIGFNDFRDKEGRLPRKTFA